MSLLGRIAAFLARHEAPSPSQAYRARRAAALNPDLEEDEEDDEDSGPLCFPSFPGPYALGARLARRWRDRAGRRLREVADRRLTYPALVRGVRRRVLTPRLRATCLICSFSIEFPPPAPAQDFRCPICKGYELRKELLRPKLA